MKKLKILFITRRLDNFVEPNTIIFSEALSKVADLTLWYDDGDLNEILSKLNFTPDFILLNEFTKVYCPNISGISSVKIPLGIRIADAHCEVEIRKKYILFNNIQHIISSTFEGFYRFFPEFSDRMFYLPLSVNTDVFKDYAMEKDINYLLMGCTVSNVYPLRYKILSEMQNEPGFEYHPHPGYAHFPPNQPGLFVKDKYAKEINRSKIFFTDGGIYDYVVLKYFEVPACRTLLMAKHINELDKLGFIAGVHYVDIDENNFLEKAHYYLNNDNERERITEQGYQFVKMRHSSIVRAYEFVKYVESILKNESSK